MNEIVQAAMSVYSNNMGLKDGEEVLVVADTPLLALGECFYQAARELGNEAVLLLFPPRSIGGEEPPHIVAASLPGADVAMLVTSQSLTHTRARMAASTTGTRMASMPGVTSEMVLTAMDLDRGQIDEMIRLGSAYAEHLSRGRTVHLTARGGTDLSFSIESRQGRVESGLNWDPGSFSNLPAGEAFIAPVEGSAEGIIVFDASVGELGRVDQPVLVKVEQGVAVSIQGGRAALKLREKLERLSINSRFVAELGIGLNPKATICGNSLQDEKVLGTVHIALGDNSTFGGLNLADSHIDGVIMEPALEIDGKSMIAPGLSLY
jgi:leucyl aminopeptidase (aminopeptidase T)